MSKLERTVRFLYAFFERVKVGCVRVMGFDPTADLGDFSILPYIQWVVWSLAAVVAYLVVAFVLGAPLGLEKRPVGDSKLYYLATGIIVIVSITAGLKFARWVILTFLPPKKPES